ncbi:MAG: hypothetical protein KF784_05645 [Fimbriimonadaceae bacterium]|nr:hypothetical protein [Fimbriimonadaceae bacterium]
MRTNKLAILGISILAVGCTSQKPTAFVDLEAAALAEAQVAALTPTVVDGTSGWSVNREVGAAEMGAEQLAARTNTDAIREARAAIEKNLADAKRSATDRLFRHYLKQVTQFRKDETKKIEEEHDLTLAKADERISVLLHELAEKRHPLVDAINPYTGFPPPALEKFLTTEDAPPAVKKLMLSIRTKLEKIIELDNEFAANKAAIYADARSQAAQRRIEMEIEIQNRIDELQQQAKKETEQIFEKDQNLYEGILVSRPGQASRGLPATNDTIGLSVPSTTLPKWSAEAPKTEEVRRSEMERDLNIFLSVRNYERTTDRTVGVDLTKDFIEWRRERRLGR